MSRGIRGEHALGADSIFHVTSWRSSVDCTGQCSVQDVCSYVPDDTACHWHSCLALIHRVHLSVGAARQRPSRADVECPDRSACWAG